MVVNVYITDLLNADILFILGDSDVVVAAVEDGFVVVDVVDGHEDGRRR